MKKKWLALGTSMIALSLVLTGCGGGSDKKDDAPKTIVMRLADNHPDGYPTVVGDLAFAKAVEEKTNGRIKIDVKASGQLGDEKAVIEQVQLGAIEFARVNASPLAEFNKPLGVFSLPYLFDSEEHLWRFLESEDGKAMLVGMESGKLRGLAYYSSGARNFYSTKELKDITSLAGLKIRVQQSRINMDMIDALGASATPMPYGQVFSSLQTGVIDGAENNFPSYDSSNHYQVAKYYILDKHQVTPEILMMSKVAWDKLSPEDQKIIQEAALESSKVQIAAWKEYEKKSLETVVAAGSTIVEVPDVTPWQEATKSVIEKYREDYAKEIDAIAKYK
jgi:tripartite ATP-independent periplasmic transporter solute receptor, DctP family